MPYQRAVEIDRLTKRFRSIAVINNLTLSVSLGEVVGILGPNGAGKSTLMRLLIGAMRPTSGSIMVLEKEVGDSAVRRKIGYLPEKCPLQEFLTARELLSLHASLLGMPRSEIDLCITKTLDRVGVSDEGRIGDLSRGTRQRLGIAVATLHNPDLIILDEPTSALDPMGRAMVREMILEFAQAGTTVLISSHLLTEIEHACSRVIILNRGEVVADGRAAELTSFTSRIDIEITAMNDRAMKALETLTARIEYDPKSPTRITAFVNDKADASAIASALVENGVGLITLEPRMETLEDLLVRLTNP
jgi:ABC-2 type transport system ATP-binding protein